MQLTRRLLPLLLAQPAARIVNVGSIFGYLGYPGHAAYCASKFALRGFSEALRRELADGPVQVTYFAPRATRTAMNGAAMCALNAELGVVMDPPESVAGALVALLEKPASERPLGMPERLFAWLNQVTPRLVDRALLRQLPVIRRYARGHAKPQPLTQGVKS
jgi:short-subunit dehydrogenase